VAELSNKQRCDLRVNEYTANPPRQNRSAYSVQVFITTRAPWRSVILSLGLLWIAAQ
jgi:hypothetical protein